MTFYEWIAEKGIVISGVVDILPALEAAWNDATKAEREACAQVCEDIRPRGGRAFDMRQHGAFDSLTVAAAAIRARTP